MAIIKQMIINAGTYPACNLDGMNTTGVGTLFNVARIAGGAANGGDCVRWTQLANGGVHTQYTYGWTINQMEPGGTDPALGSTRYHRFYVKPVGTQDYTGNNGPWYTKFILQGVDNPGVDEGRMIVNFGVGHINNADTYAEPTKNVSGIGVICGPMSNNNWHSVQVEVKSATTLLGTNGSLKIWFDQDNFGSPTDTETGINLTVNGWGGQSTAIMGGFAQTTVALTGLVVHDVDRYQYADSFDSSWFANMGGGGGATAVPVFVDNSRRQGIL